VDTSPYVVVIEVLQALGGSDAGLRWTQRDAAERPCVTPFKHRRTQVADRRVSAPLVEELRPGVAAAGESIRQRGLRRREERPTTALSSQLPRQLMLQRMPYASSIR
jgi:hypothetical protein